ncbi:hypothetical protein NGM36_13145 [Streptomyces mutabilis]|uniref:hypothetical protein n=1 Tax=Streptomyces mutabilis TaxID=67332 RepID=UPI0022BA50FB|nr:hypothetical protein [Streptomyces mutabilis]MCZ9350733.1 hypothetical protein [Streptomyces mutabilis]
MPTNGRLTVLFPHPRATSTDLAKAAYAAYAEATDNKNVRGDELPEWDDLTTSVQNAWRLAAEAVRHRVELTA